MFCNHCGKQNEDGVRFCLHCGARLEQPGQEPPKQEPPKQEPPKQEPPKQEPSKEKTAKPKKKKKTGLIITAVVLVLVLLGELGVYLFLKNREEEVTLSDLTADSVHLVADHEETILFTVKVSQQVEAVDLYLDDEAVEEMYDDGKAGDAEGGDGIYSCQISVKEAAEKVETLQYYCKYKKVKSDPVNIYIFPMLDEAAAREARTVYENLAAEIGEIESEAANADGYVPADKQAAVIEEIVEELEEAKEDETVLYYQVEDNTEHGVCAQRRGRGCGRLGYGYDDHYLAALLYGNGRKQFWLELHRLCTAGGCRVYSANAGCCRTGCEGHSAQLQLPQLHEPGR